jgi:peptidoglycan/xylan/chitin deacetylase (PgdA/CDA1 family)
VVAISDLPEGLILVYHGVFPAAPEEIRVGFDNTSPDELKRQLVWLNDNYDVIDVDTWFSLDDRRGQVAITFDDGYSSALQEAGPLLEALDITAAFFLNGSMLDGHVFWRDRIRYLIRLRLEEQFIRFLPLDFAESSHLSVDNFFEATKGQRINSLRIAALVDRFFSESKIGMPPNYCANAMMLADDAHFIFGSHSYDHPNFASLTEEQARVDIRRNRSALRQLSLSWARFTEVFALPFGTSDFYTDQTLDMLADEGYSRVLLVASEPHALHQSRSQRVQLASRLVAPSSLAKLQLLITSGTQSRISLNGQSA